MNVTNFNCGISDVHNLIAVQIKGSIIQRKNELKVTEVLSTFFVSNQYFNYIKF
jgi:outer membrane scaffolding protein for murein synthesis (MipA/OmpV family)